MRQKIKRFFKTDEAYNDDLKKYTKTDGMIAILYYLVFMITYYLMGRVYAEKQIYLGIVCNIGLAILSILLVLIRKQKLRTLGLTLRKQKQAVIFGTVLGLILVFVNNVIPAILSGSQFTRISNLLYNTFYYFIIIAFVEEIAFRGFIQTRIYGLIKNDLIAVIVVSLMFSFMHIPFQMALSATNLVTFLANNVIWLLLLLLWHIIFNFLHRKNNNIITNTIFHGFMDWGSSLFL